MRLPVMLGLVPSLALAGGFQRLYSDAATASSYLKSNWNKYEENYHPNYALDDDPKTAWVEGAEGEGVGETISIPVSALKSARAVRLVIFNGYQKSKALLAANGAPKEVTVRVIGPSGKESAKKQLTLEKKLGAQQFELPVTAGVAEVILRIDSVHPGKVYKDTCLSDVQVFVDSQVPYLKAVEEGKRKTLAAWKRDRLDNAKYFASLPPESPYATNNYNAEAESKLLTPRWSGVTERPGESSLGVPNKDYQSLDAQLGAGKLPGAISAGDQKLIVELDKLRRAGPPKTGRFFQLETKTKEHVPDGVPVPVALAPLVHLGTATLFEAKSFGSIKPVSTDSGEEGYSHSESLSNVMILDGSATDPKKVLLVHVETTSERTTTSQTTWLLAELSGGRLQRLATIRKSDDDYHQQLEAGVAHFGWEDEKLRTVEVSTLVDAHGMTDEPDPANDGISVSSAKVTPAPRS